MPTHKLPNGEFHCEWTCPKCGHYQHDSVHVEHGPFLTCICGQCGKDFDQTQLTETDQASWADAIEATNAVD